MIYEIFKVIEFFVLFYILVFIPTYIIYKSFEFFTSDNIRR